MTLLLRLLNFGLLNRNCGFGLLSLRHIRVAGGLLIIGDLLFGLLIGSGTLSAVGFNASCLHGCIGRRLYVGLTRTSATLALWLFSRLFGCGFDRFGCRSCRSLSLLSRLLRLFSRLFGLLLFRLSATLFRSILSLILSGGGLFIGFTLVLALVGDSCRPVNRLLIEDVIDKIFFF